MKNLGYIYAAKKYQEDPEYYHGTSTIPVTAKMKKAFSNMSKYHYIKSKMFESMAEQKRIKKPTRAKKVLQ